MTGHNSIKMADLAKMYKDLGFSDVQTYIQSGNVVFKTVDGLSLTGLSKKIEGGIHKNFGHTVPAIIRTIPDLNGIISANPFLDEANFDQAKNAVIFLYDKPVEDQIRKVADVSYPPDKFSIIGREIYTYCPNGFGKTKLYTNFFESKMKVTGTARNWKTITTILNIALQS
jgi:uncharacterized protein (DUF1697 family)